ncbi:MAG TPA: extracellular solute-binding protein [Clostridiales bacterium]|nr:extracellular solute-binding protein [Clostridiales bacterium]
MKKVLSLILVALLITGILSGCVVKSNETKIPDAASNETKASAEAKKLLPKPTTFTIMTFEHPSTTVNPYGIRWQEVFDKTNVKLEFDITPQGDFNAKLATVLASGVISDITWVKQNNTTEYGKKLFMDLTDKLETELPNYWRKVKDDINFLKTKVEGRVYSTYFLQNDNYPGGLVPVIRYDLLEKHNLPMPETFEQWFEVMKQLKNLYPDSTPYSGRGGRNTPLNLEYAMGAQRNLNYDLVKQRYVYGVLEPEYRKILEFLNKCYAEGILDNGYMNTNANTWAEGAANNKIFFWYDNGGFATSQTLALRQNNPNALMQIMPLMENAQGEKRGQIYAKHWYNEQLVFSKNTSKPEELLKFINWMYSDEALLINNLGKEGITYNVLPNGEVELPKELVDKYKVSTSPDDAWQSDLGVGYLNVTPFVGYTPLLGKALGTFNEGFYDVLLPDLKAGYYKEQWVAVVLDPEVKKSINELEKQINSLINNQIPKFIDGTRPLSEFDQFVAEVKKLGAEDVLKAYNDAVAALK